MRTMYLLTTQKIDKWIKRLKEATGSFSLLFQTDYHQNVQRAKDNPEAFNCPTCHKSKSIFSSSYLKVQFSNLHGIFPVSEVCNLPLHHQFSKKFPAETFKVQKR